MIVISGILRVATEDRDRAVGLVEPLVQASLAEEGCAAYGFWESPLESGLFRVFEEWASEEALNVHFAAPHFVEFMGAMGSLKIEEMDLSRYEVSGKKPLFG